MLAFICAAMLVPTPATGSAGVWCRWIHVAVHQADVACSFRLFLYMEDLADYCWESPHSDHRPEPLKARHTNPFEHSLCIRAFLPGPKGPKQAVGEGGPEVSLLFASNGPPGPPLYMEHVRRQRMWMTASSGLHHDQLQGAVLLLLPLLLAGAGPQGAQVQLGKYNRYQQATVVAQAGCLQAASCSGMHNDLLQSPWAVPLQQ